MSDLLIQRLRNKRFTHYNEHIKLVGGHIAPIEHFNLVYDLCRIISLLYSMSEQQIIDISLR